MNQVVAGLLRGIFNNINPTTAYRLGLWINGLIAAMLGALLSGGVQWLGQVTMLSGPVKWAKVLEWAEAGVFPAVLGYYTKSPIRTVFDDSTVTVETTSKTTPTTQTDSVTTTIKPNDP